MWNSNQHTETDILNSTPKFDIQNNKLKHNENIDADLERYPLIGTNESWMHSAFWLRTQEKWISYGERCVRDGKKCFANISGYFTARDVHAANFGTVTSNHNYEEDFSLKCLI